MSGSFKVGKLKFKEGVSRPAYLPKKARKEEEEAEDEQDVIAPDKVVVFEPTVGAGSVTTSGRTIHGSDTHFRAQLEAGDSIIVQNAVLGTREERTVTLILSDKSILLEEPFLEECSSFVPYLIRKKSKVTPGENVTQKYKEGLEELAKTKAIKKDELSVRLKKGFWSYETKKVEVGANLSREQQLDVRQKLIKDKHCW
jgi:hypothetical protein